LVDFAYANNIVQGKTPTIFDPNGFITRGEMAVMAIKAYNQ
jgi:hypothetical protein